MIMTPSSFTYEHLSSLKFKELQKLSVQFHVNKRWAKKQELIENLLALKEKNETVVESEQEWRDANTVFGDLKFKTENEDNKRLTYNVSTKCSTEHNDPHLTFEVPQNGKNLLCQTVYSRETYDIPPSKADFGIELPKELRSTFEIPPKEKLIEEADSTAAFDVFENKQNLMERDPVRENKNLNEKISQKKSLSHLEVNMKEVDGSKPLQGMKNVKFAINSKNGEQKKEKEKPQVKMLTIPHARVTRRLRAAETFGNERSPIKMSRKSINIKKSTRLPVNKEDFMKSPFSSVQSSVNKQTLINSLTKSQPGKVVQSKMPIRVQFQEEKSKSANDNNKENIKKISRSQLSKTTDKPVNKKSNSVKTNFNTLTRQSSSNAQNNRVVALKKAAQRKDPKERLDASTIQTPKNKLISKPITATKMPDFGKIHKRHFEQMDSLHDYLKKKEDRIRKLFGTPQPGQQLHNLNKSAPVFHFRSTITEKENTRSEGLKTIAATPLKKKENDLKLTQKEAFKSKLRTDIKDKNRSHIHGVRTNKRFELQMKFRNM